MSNLNINRPIAGEVNRSERRKYDQYDAESFLREVDKLLSVDGIDGIAWSQYTPYFNDGDVCEFGLHGAAVKLSADFNIEEGIETEAYLQNADGAYFSEYDLYVYPEKGDWKNRLFEINGKSTKEIYDALIAFQKAMHNHLDVLETNFGDHAEVFATKAGFWVEEHDHE